MDYVVGSVAALISGNVTPNRPKLTRRAITPTKHQPSPNVTPKSELVEDRSIFLSPTLQKKKAIVKKSPKRIFQNDSAENSDGGSSLAVTSPKAVKVKKHLKDELEAGGDSKDNMGRRSKSKSNTSLDKSLDMKMDSEILDSSVSHSIENTSMKKMKTLSGSNSVEIATAEPETAKDELSDMVSTLTKNIPSAKKRKDKRKSTVEDIESMDTDIVEEKSSVKENHDETPKAKKIKLDSENNSQKTINAEPKESSTGKLSKSQKRRLRKMLNKQKQIANNINKDKLNNKKDDQQVNTEIDNIESESKKNKKQKKLYNSEIENETNNENINPKNQTHSQSEHLQFKSPKKNKKNKSKSQNEQSNNTENKAENIGSKEIIDETAKSIEESIKSPKKNKKNKSNSQNEQSNNTENTAENIGNNYEPAKSIEESTRSLKKKKKMIQVNVIPNTGDESKSSKKKKPESNPETVEVENNQVVEESKPKKKKNIVNPNAITDKDSDSEHESDDEIESENEEVNKKALETNLADESSSDEEEELKREEKKEKIEHIMDADEIKRTLFVGNVPFSAKCKKQVKKIFNKYGRIVTVRIRTVPVKDARVTPKLAVIKNELHPERTTVNMYVKFADPESVEKALVENNTLLDENHLRVTRSDRTGAEHDPRSAIFVGNLPFALEDDTLRAKFEKCGEIESVRIVRDKKTNAGKGFGFVNFTSKDGVELALALSEEDLTIKNRILRVKRCTQGPQRQAQKQIKPKWGEKQEGEGAFRRLMHKRENQDGNGEGPPNKRQKNLNQPMKEKKPRKEFVGMTAEKKKKHKFDKGQKKKKVLSQILANKS